MLNKGRTTNFSYHLGLDFNHIVHETQGPATLFSKNRPYDIYGSEKVKRGGAYMTN